MRINEIIKEKRLQQNMTQEQVANYLGVSTSAVNKWEKNISFPDITLLPSLARLLNTDLNTLLSFKDELTQKEITLFLNDIAQMINTEGFEKAYEASMNKIKEYPTCYPLLLHVAILLDGALKLYTQKEHIKEFYTNIESLYQRVLSSKDMSLVNQAKYFLISKFIERKQFDQAKDMLDTIPDENTVDKKQLQVQLYIATDQLEEASKYQEEKILSLTNQIQSQLLILMDIALKQHRIEDAKYIANVSHQSAKLFDLWQYSTHIADFQLHLACKEYTKCIKTFLTMLQSLTLQWNINNSPLYKHIHTKKLDKDFGLKMQKHLIESTYQDKETSFIIDSQEFKDFIKDFK